MVGTPAEAPVADAAQRGDIEVVRTLLRSGGDVNAAQGDGMTALHWAAMNGRSDIVEVLLYAGATPESTTRLGAYTPLHLAAREGHAEVIDRLLNGFARHQTRTATGVTALHYAAASGRADAVQALLSHGAEIDARAGSREQTALMWATAYNRPPAIRVLLEAGAGVALTSGVVDVVAVAALDRPARQQRRALVTAQRAAAEGPQEAAEGLGRPGPGEPPEARSPRAPQEEEKPEERSPEEQGEAVPEEAARPEDTVQKEGAAPPKEEPAPPDEEARPQDEGATPQDEAAPQGEEAAPQGESEQQEVAEEQEEKAEEKAEEERALGYNDLVGLEGGFTALHFAARDGHVEAARLLLEFGADLDQGTAGDGTTPLLMATINGNFDLAMEFLALGADPNIVAEDGAAPLFTVLNRRWGPKAAYPQPSAFTQQETDYLVLLSALIDAGADVNQRTERHIWYTSFNFDQLGVRFAGATAFWRAAYATDVAAMRLLVEAGADPAVATRKVPSRRFGRRRNADDEDKSGLEPIPNGGPAVWPIQAASGVGYGEGFAANSHSHAPDSWLASVRYLVEELGADVNARDHNGYAALHHAAARGDNELIEYLVSQGADVTVVSRRGETTVDMANGPRQRVQPFPETIALLEGMGAVNSHNCQSC
jgi:uncharacterized protein